VDSKKDALSPELQQYCYGHQVALIKGLTTALRIDLSYFSTKTLMEVASEVDVEVRTQLKMPSDVNTDASGVET
jgi:histone demethylase